MALGSRPSALGLLGLWWWQPVAGSGGDIEPNRSLEDQSSGRSVGDRFDLAAGDEIAQLANADTQFNGGLFAGEILLCESGGDIPAIPTRSTFPGDWLLGVGSSHLCLSLPWIAFVVCDPRSEYVLMAMENTGFTGKIDPELLELPQCGNQTVTFWHHRLGLSRDAFTKKLKIIGVKPTLFSLIKAEVLFGAIERYENGKQQRKYQRKKPRGKPGSTDATDAPGGGVSS